MSGLEVWPGPMEGVGGNEFVRAASALQLTDKWMTPFIRITDNIPSVGKICKSIAGYLESDLPITAQVMGCDPDLLGKCGRILLDFPRVTGVNLNMGCPSKRVVKHFCGGGMLHCPERAVEQCLALASFLPAGKFSVKIRSGFDDPEDMEKFLPPLVSSGVISKVFFHYRTVAESYRNIAPEERVRRIAAAVMMCGKTPLIANGDIDSVADAEMLAEKTGCAGVMIARPWMRDPFLLRRFKGSAITPEEGRERFFDSLCDADVPRGTLIEVAKMLWGCRSTRFNEILSEFHKY